jgi:hypothetical protein
MADPRITKLEIHEYEYTLDPASPASMPAAAMPSIRPCPALPTI